jgi:hypothetical protein
MPTLWQLVRQPGFKLSAVGKATLVSLKAQLESITGIPYTVSNNCPLSLAAQQLTEKFKKKKVSASKFLESSAQRVWLGSVNIEVFITQGKSVFLGKHIKYRRYMMSFMQVPSEDNNNDAGGLGVEEG